MQTHDSPYSVWCAQRGAYKTLSAKTLVAASTSHKRWAEEQALDKLNNALTVELLARALLDGKALVQGGAHQIVEHLGIDGCIKWRELSLSDEGLEVGVQGARDLILGAL